jgi:hypothetical protein
MRISDSLHGWKDYSKRVLYSRPKTKPFHGPEISFHLERTGSSGRNIFNTDVIPIDATMIANNQRLSGLCREVVN